MQYPNIDGIPVTPQYSSKYHSPVHYNANRIESGTEQGEIAFWASDAGREALCKQKEHINAEQTETLDPTVERMRAICMKLPYSTKEAVAVATGPELVTIIRRAAFYMLNHEDRAWLEENDIRNSAKFDPPRDYTADMRRAIAAGYKSSKKRQVL